MDKGKVQTVLGNISPDELGVTLCHEHLSMSFDVAYTPAQADKKHMETAPFSLGNLGWIRQNPYSHKANWQIKEDPEAVCSDLSLFKKCGGGTLVENSTLGLERDMESVVMMSRETGVHVVAGTGYYVGDSLPVAFDSWTMEDLVNEMTRDLTIGVGDGNVKCGVIGEIGCSWPLSEREKKSLRATAAVQSALRCPVIIHPGRDPESVYEITRVLQEAGGDVKKTVMSHLDRTLLTKEALLKFAEIGCYCEFDLFGVEASHYQLAPTIDMPNDAQRIERIKWLLDEGFGDQVLMSHDIHTRHRLVPYGGHGYSHILENVVPMMLIRNITQNTIDHILINNPKRWLTV